MASSSSDEKVLMEAATDADIPDARDEDCWPALRMYLKCNKVDVNSRKPAEWMKAFDRYRKALRKNERAFLAGRSSSTGSERGSDIGSSPDSGYDTGSPGDLNDQLDLEPQDIYAYVLPIEEGGRKEPLCCCYCNETVEDYIIETARERLNLNKMDKDGKVTVTWHPQGGGKTSKTRCAVRPDEEGKADLVLTTKKAEKVESGSKQEQSEEQGSRDTSQSREASRRLQQQVGQTEQPELEKTLAYLFEKPSIRGLDDENVTELGRKVQLAIRGAATAKAPEDP